MLVPALRCKLKFNSHPKNRRITHRPAKKLAFRGISCSMKVRLTRVSIDLIKVADEIQNPATERRTMDTNRKRPRPLSDGEIAGMILEDTFNPNETRYRKDYMGEFHYDEADQKVEGRRE